MIVESSRVAADVVFGLQTLKTGCVLALGCARGWDRAYLMKSVTQRLIRIAGFGVFRSQHSYFPQGPSAGVLHETLLIG
jgi:hypothetical protein